MNLSKLILLTVSVGLLASLLTGYVNASPNIHFTDYRVLLTEKQNTKNYQIFNQGDTDAYCYTNLIDHNVSSDGRLTVADSKNLPKTSAQSLLRVSPKRVLIPAKSNQKVRVLARRLNQQKDGEWVSYLNLRCREQTANLEQGIKIQPNFVFNIPVVVRKGELPVRAALKNSQLAHSNNRYYAQMVLARDGQRSLFGNITVSDESGVIAVRNGLSHYLQSDEIPLVLPLKSEPKGQVKIEFNELPQFGGDITLTNVIK